MQYKVILSAILLAGCGPTITVDGKAIPNAPEHVVTAIDKYGLNEYQNKTVLKEYVGVDPRYTEWCAAFVNAVLEESGIPGSDSVSDNPLMARSFLEWGKEVKDPLAGDVVVFPRGRVGWQGHVGFYVGKETRNGVLYYRILGGNQNNSVNIELYPASRALGIRRML
tara:strand:- start:398 stop:898 length:501 start_codon:yes stop_codon:yes gene_type:complete